MFLDIHGGPESWNPFERCVSQLPGTRGRGVCGRAPNPEGASGTRGVCDAGQRGLGRRGRPRPAGMRGRCHPSGAGGQGSSVRRRISYGGYMSAWMVGHTTASAACVGAPVIDLVAESEAGDVGVMAADAGGDPWDSSRILQERSPLTHVPSVNTPVFLYVFEGDLRCPTDQADAFFNGLRWHLKESSTCATRAGRICQKPTLAHPVAERRSTRPSLDFLSRHGGGHRSVPGQCQAGPQAS